jgi:VWFA-related protein
MRAFALLTLTCLTLTCLALTAQTKEDEATFSTDVKVVNIFATVRNKAGEIIRDLPKDDFSVLENGRQQAIRFFSQESDLPLTIGLMVDTSMSQAKVLNAERGASFRFIDQVLREGKDKVFIMQFDMAIRLRQDLTSSRKALDESLAYVDTPSRRELYMPSDKGTVLYDAVLEASNGVMKDRTGRKALIVMSDGVDEGSENSLASAIEAAQRNDTIVYSILFSDPSFYGGGLGGHSGKDALSRLAKQTGGSFFEVTKKRSIDDIFGVIEQELRSEYSLGFVSDTPVRNSEFRTLQLTTKQKDLIVHARDKYWARR